MLQFEEYKVKLNNLKPELEAVSYTHLDRDRARLARLRDDIRLALVILGVQDGVPDALGLEDLG